MSFVEYQVRNYSKDHGSTQLYSDLANYKLKLEKNYKNICFYVFMGVNCLGLKGNDGETPCACALAHANAHAQIAICMKFQRQEFLKIFFLATHIMAI